MRFFSIPLKKKEEISAAELILVLRFSDFFSLSPFYLCSKMGIVFLEHEGKLFICL